MIVGLLIGASGGIFIGMVIMALCVASSRESRKEEMKNNTDESLKKKEEVL